VTAATARTTYDATADHFDAPSLGFWDRYGARTVDRLALRPGARVLDVCAGTGGSALPAARAVGPGGSVTAIDVSAPLLDRARRKAEREGLTHLEVRVADMTRLELPAATFDAVVIVFGIFFAPDMVRQARELARLVRPRGVLAITTWGPRMFEPLYAPFLASARRLHPGLDDFRPWARLTTPDAVSALLRDAGQGELEVEPEAGTEPLRGPGDWWTIVLGTGLRWVVDQLPVEVVDAFREENLERAREVAAIETNVIYATARITQPGDER
jgi:ubiquinone/menaquinone biosynthesis C-methylase UbiE